MSKILKFFVVKSGPTTLSIRRHNHIVAIVIDESTSGVTSRVKSHRCVNVRAHAPVAQVMMSQCKCSVTSDLLSLARWACFQCKFDE